MHRRDKCARCGRVSNLIEMIRSRHTNLRYCRDVAVCDARVAKRDKAKAATA